MPISGDATPSMLGYAFQVIYLMYLIVHSSEYRECTFKSEQNEDIEIYDPSEDKYILIQVKCHTSTSKTSETIYYNKSKKDEKRFPSGGIAKVFERYKQYPEEYRNKIKEIQYVIILLPDCELKACPIEYKNAILDNDPFKLEEYVRIQWGEYGVDTTLLHEFCEKLCYYIYNDKTMSEYIEDVQISLQEVSANIEWTSSPSPDYLCRYMMSLYFMYINEHIYQSPKYVFTYDDLTKYITKNVNKEITIDVLANSIVDLLKSTIDLGGANIDFGIDVIIQSINQLRLSSLLNCLNIIRINQYVNPIVVNKLVRLVYKRFIKDITHCVENNSISDDNYIRCVHSVTTLFRKNRYAKKLDFVINQIQTNE